jgi:hypothetical protein
MFEYDHIYNIKIIRADRFSPIIPIMPIINWDDDEKTISKRESGFTNWPFLAERLFNFK